MRSPLALLSTAILPAALWSGSCGSEPEPEPADASVSVQHAPDAQGDSGTPDRDRDGLCDGTEDELGTSPERLDSDDDGLSDLLELGNQFDPLSASTPSDDELVVLDGAFGASVTRSVRATVRGDGTGITGFFEAAPNLYDPGASADDYYAGGLAVSADPSDNVRGFDSAQQRFAVVVGDTRLGFELSFAYRAAAPQPCARAYRFNYVLKSDAGVIVLDRAFLLLITPPGLGREGGLAPCPTEPCL